MSPSDNIYMLLGAITKQHKAVRELEQLVGEQLTTAVSRPAVLTEYTRGITLDEPATPFNKLLAVYGDVPISTFSILA